MKYIIFMFLFLVGCDNNTVQEREKAISTLKSELEQTKNQLNILQLENQEKDSLIEELNQKIDETINEPNKQYNIIKEAISNNNFEESIKLIQEYITKYQCSDKISELNSDLENAKKQLEEEKKKEIEKKKIKTEGFAKLKTITSLKTDNLSIAFNRIKKSNVVAIDRYEDRYFEHTAEKDSVVIFADITITSSAKNPKLPNFYVATLAEDGEITNMGYLFYSFYRWEDYGTYLGNYHDKKNDFAYTNTIKFVIRRDMPKGKYKYIIFTDGKEKWERKEERHEHPIYIPDIGNLDVSVTPTIEDFADKYQLIKILE